jgi:hypothetical protein
MAPDPADDRAEETLTTTKAWSHCGFADSG